jgi:hypothetical protein
MVLTAVDSRLRGNDNVVDRLELAEIHIIIKA